MYSICIISISWLSYYYSSKFFVREFSPKSMVADLIVYQTKYNICIIYYTIK